MRYQSGVTDDTTRPDPDPMTPRERARIFSPLQPILRLGLDRELDRLKAAGVMYKTLLARKNKSRRAHGLGDGLRDSELGQLRTGKRAVSELMLDDLVRMGLDLHELLAAGDGLPSRAELARAFLVELELACEGGARIIDDERRALLDGACELVRLDDERRALEASMVSASRATEREQSLDLRAIIGEACEEARERMGLREGGGIEP
jgi:hypothetical protein